MIETRCYQKRDLTAEDAEAFAEERREDILTRLMTVRSKTFFCRGLVLSVLILVTSVAIFGQEQPLNITYHLAMSHPNSHLFEVSIEVATPPDAKFDSLDFQMPRWSPGRYAVFDFAKNVQEFHAFHGVCAASADCMLPSSNVARLDDQTWRVQTHGVKNMVVTYKVFGNDLSGTFSQLNSRHANFNGGCIFMYVVNHKQDPVSLSINPPKTWRIVNGRMDKKGQPDWEFPNWDILIDTPTEIAPDWTEDDFKVNEKTYRVVVHSLGNEGGKRPDLIRGIEKIVRTETAMWGPPEFDSYTFLIHFANDGHSSDGME